MNHFLTTVRIVLIETFHPGNIGAAARAMKTMGLETLYLVNPVDFPNAETTSRAAGANDVLENAKVLNSLNEAVADCTQVFATTARQKQGFARPQKTCEQAVSWMGENSNEKIAIVFGPERTGMSAASIEQCQQVLYIPGNPNYDVLNMASAVQIVCYELFRQQSKLSASQIMADDSMNSTRKSARLADAESRQAYFDRVEQLLIDRKFIREDIPSDTMKKFRQLIEKANPTASDMALLRGISEGLSRTPK